MFGVLGDFLLSKRMEQGVCIKFCVKNGIQCSKALEMLTIAYGESTLSKKKVYKWYYSFGCFRHETCVSEIRSKIA